MNSFSLVSAIIRGEWAIDPQYALNSLPLVERILNGTFTGLQQEALEPSFLSFDDEEDDPKKHKSAKVLLAPVKGVLMKEDGMCGVPGMATMAGWIRQANADPEIAGMVLMIDSPGGTVDGTEFLANTIKNSNKPVVAWIDGQAASAALWIASAATEVMASLGNDEVGSVGAMLNFADMQPVMEKDGVRFHTIISDQTPDKNKLAFEVLRGDYQSYKTEYLNRVAQNFIDSVKANRPDVPDSQLTGKMYFAKDVIGTLVDSVGSLDDAVNRVLELAKKNEPSSIKISMNQFNRINSVLGVDALESVDEVVALNEEQLDLIESSLEAVTQDTAGLNEQLTQANTSLESIRSEFAQAVAEREAAMARIQELESRIGELENQPGADPAQVIKKTDGDSRNTLEMPLSVQDVELFNAIRR